MPRGFSPLTVTRVEPLTDDSAAITFAVPAELAETFTFAAGQALMVRRGAERRSYSICSPVGTAPRIGVREVPGGELSGWLVHGLRAGDVVEVGRPTGSFTPAVGAGERHVMIAAGSGITPVLSMAATLLAGDASSHVTLLYGNRRSDTVMFADEVADLKNAFPTRMQLVHVLSREPQEVDLHTGRIDAAKLRALLPVTVDVAGVDHWWLCGPFGMVTDALEVLTDLGVPGDRLHRELFYVEAEPPAEVHHDATEDATGAEVTVVLDGRTTTTGAPAGATVLDAASAARPDLPFACKGGVCGTCRALVTHGEVRMRRNYALEPAEVEAGYVLTCQSVPVTESVSVDYDS